MHVHRRYHISLGALRTRPWRAVALFVLLIASSATIGTATANASTATPSTTPPVEVSGLPTGEVEKLLSEIPLGGSTGIPPGNLEVPQLAKLLAQLKGISGLSGLPGLGGASGLEQALSTAIEEFLASGGKLDELLNPAVLGPKLESALRSSLGPVLGPQLETLVETLLHKSPAAVIGEGLGSLNASELVGSLLKEAKEPEKLIGQLLGAAQPETLKALLGTTLTGEPFIKTTVSGLSSSLGTTPETLATSLGKTVEQLPATAMALITPLTDGKTLATLDGLGGITLSILGGSKGGGPEGSGGAGGSGGPGSPGASGNGAQGVTTVLVTPVVRATGQHIASRAAAKAGRLRIISHRVRGRTATILVQVPTAGKLAVRGRGVKTVRREASESERLTLRVVPSRAGAASLRKHHRLRVKLTATFRPSNGPNSTATLTVTFN